MEATLKGNNKGEGSSRRQPENEQHSMSIKYVVYPQTYKSIAAVTLILLGPAGSQLLRVSTSHIHPPFNERCLAPTQNVLQFLGTLCINQ
jgi:hypothetical protein